MMELLAPAGNLEKLRIAYQYGADAAYIGLSGFSLRAQADNFHPDEGHAVRALKGGRKLYGAFNLYCKDDDIARLDASIEAIQAFPFDAFIISDLGLLPFMQRHFSGVELHLSTQANCLNIPSARIYQDLGFARIIVGREMSLDEIARLKQAVPELEIETFVHGAMCLAYSGRCFLSAWMTGRSANQGDCAHSCRWKYRLKAGDLSLEEAERPGEYFPVFEGDGFTSILSSKDLCLIDHLAAFRDAGVDSLKIEGRMKSAYYVAMVTRAYRRELDRVQGRPGAGTLEETRPFIEELYKASHREYSTGFFFGSDDITQPTDRSSEASHLFLASLGVALQPDPAWVALHDPTLTWFRYEIDVKNKFLDSDAVEFVTPTVASGVLYGFVLVDLSGRDCPMALVGRYHELYTSQQLEPGSLLRKNLPWSAR
jgi:putative protease